MNALLTCLVMAVAMAAAQTATKSPNAEKSDRAAQLKLNSEAV
jgi:hypothetical protein